ncbi:carboxymuconolactone decarboxylase family protein [Roseibium sp.]|uniref:carboxymuconolactone decarboxylase family protein n=1 Tax=Roseibium sp. TaxID=1936156 RepID=UPI003D0968D1
MAVSDWTSFLKQTDARMAAVRKGAPDVAKAFGALAGAATKPGALDPKTKELIALAIGITARCDGCLAYHARAAAHHGATREEILDVIGVSVYMGGGPSMIYGAEALAAFDGLAE